MPLDPKRSWIRENRPSTRGWNGDQLAIHLQAMVNGGRAGLFTFDVQQDLLVVSDRLMDVLALGDHPGPLHKTLHLFEASPLFALDAIDQMRDAIACALVSGPADVSNVTLATVCCRSFELHISQIGPNVWMASCEDVTARRAAEDKAAELALLDPLTGLANRRLLTERIAERHASNDAPRPWMMLIDLDRFKAVNDTLGHSVGDGLLKLVSKRLRSLVRDDDVAARLGGDEFAILLTSATDAEAVERLAKRVIDIIGRPYLVEGHVVHVGASVGIASVPDDAGEPDQMARNADLAMYASKRAGRNTFRFFDPSMDANALARRSMENDLRKAVVLSQLELHYQPQIDLEKDGIVGFEALVRWRHPTRGLVLPGDFIPLAEEIGLIVPIGEWVLREACLEAMRWPEHMTVAVNVSPCQFEQAGLLVDAISKALKVSGLPGCRLEIEITESVLLRNETAVLAALHQFRAMGVLIAMDDFGTGYSSLSQLNSFPFNKIKIDQSFVTGAADAGNANAIVRAISALGQSLGMSTIAEGVETSGDLARIRSNGCTSVQGYLFSKPLPVEGIDALIAGFAARQAIPNIHAA